MTFYDRWHDKGSEKSDTQTFWLELLHDILHAENPSDIIKFEQPVKLSHMSFIDAYIPSTGILIEQKGSSIDLNEPQKQSDGSMLTPFRQAKRYYDWLEYSHKGRYIVICNFRELHVHDMEHPRDDPEIILLEDFEKDSRKLEFLIDIKADSPQAIHQAEISEAAGLLVKKFHDSVKSRYIETSPENIRTSLSILCTRLVFLLYAEDSGIYRPYQFHDFIKAHKNTARTSLIQLFETLSTKDEHRSPYLDDDLKSFHYVNGGLFRSNDDVEIPKLDGEPIDILINEMSEGFDWHNISPSIFGAIFESTLDDERREGGIHYTTPQNIHRVIDPLFLDELKDELNSALSIKTASSRTKKLRALQDKLASLTFLDPACGSGNFLTETYIELRRLENKILAEIRPKDTQHLAKKQQILAVTSPEEAGIKVNISQFYGIEINTFAVAVAQTALYIAQHQMIKETERIAQVTIETLPLKEFTNIHKANALRIDWNNIIPREELCYIMGNPPFFGHQWRTDEQNTDMKLSFPDLKEYGKFDYVCAWYSKALDFIKGTEIKAAFVSTNSIIQGELINTFWKYMREKGADMFFAYRPFIWTSGAVKKAHVHCVIIGFTCGIDIMPKYIYDSSGTEPPHA